MKWTIRIALLCLAYSGLGGTVHADEARYKQVKVVGATINVTSSSQGSLNYLHVIATDVAWSVGAASNFPPPTVQMGMTDGVRWALVTAPDNYYFGAPPDGPG